jgi:hypothetical protein
MDAASAVNAENAENAVRGVATFSGIPLFVSARREALARF